MMAPLVRKDMVLFPGPAKKKSGNVRHGQRSRAQSVQLLSAAQKAHQPLKAHSASVDDVSRPALPQHHQHQPAAVDARHFDAKMTPVGGGRAHKWSLNEACRLESVREAENESTSTNLAGLRSSSSRNCSGDTDNQSNNNPPPPHAAGGIGVHMGAPTHAHSSADTNCNTDKQQSRSFKDRTRTFFRKLTGSSKDS